MSVVTPDEAQRDAFAPIVQHAFTPDVPSIHKWFETAGHDMLRVLVRDDVVVGGCIVIPMGQAFGGRFVSMTGLAGVATRADLHRQGVATELMHGVLHDLRDRGVPLCSLYGSTAPLYRKCGWEAAGRTLHMVVPTLEIPDLGRPLTPRVFTPADKPAVRSFYESVARGIPGWLQRGDYVWGRVWGEHRGHPAHGLIFTSDEGIEAWLAYRKNPAFDRHTVTLTDAVASTARGWRQLWTALSDLSSMATEVRFTSDPADPLWLSHPDPRFGVEEAENWLMRIVDPVKALEARGWPAVSGRVDLHLTDPVFGDSRHTLEVDAGQAEVRDGGAGTVTISTNGLAAVYAGFVHPRAAVQLGWAEGPDNALDVLGRLCAGPAPWVRDHW